MFLINLYAFIKCKIHKIFHTQMQIRILNDILVEIFNF